MIRNLFSPLLLLGSLLTVSCVYAQFVEVKININPKVTVMLISEPNTQEDEKNNKVHYSETDHDCLFWFEISSSENLQVLIDIPSISRNKPAALGYRINTGHFDISKASILTAANMCFPLDGTDKNRQPNTNIRYRAWLGIPHTELPELQIVYN